jgi:hypothetical protein
MASTCLCSENARRSAGPSGTGHRIHSGGAKPNPRPAGRNTHKRVQLDVALRVSRLTRYGASKRQAEIAARQRPEALTDSLPHMSSESFKRVALCRERDGIGRTYQSVTADAGYDAPHQNHPVQLRLASPCRFAAYIYPLKQGCLPGRRFNG